MLANIRKLSCTHVAILKSVRVYVIFEGCRCPMQCLAAVKQPHE